MRNIQWWPKITTTLWDYRISCKDTTWFQVYCWVHHDWGCTYKQQIMQQYCRNCLCAVILFCHKNKLKTWFLFRDKPAIMAIAPVIVNILFFLCCFAFECEYKTWLLLVNILFLKCYLLQLFPQISLMLFRLFTQKSRQVARRCPNACSLYHYEKNIEITLRGYEGC